MNAIKRAGRLLARTRRIVRCTAAGMIAGAGAGSFVGILNKEDEDLVLAGLSLALEDLADVIRGALRGEIDDVPIRVRDAFMPVLTPRVCEEEYARLTHKVDDDQAEQGLRRVH